LRFRVLFTDGEIDDVAIVCNHLKITKFSILAHSAGAIYALATALRIPQHIRGRIHLLAPWIPPSQLSGLGTHKASLPNSAVPYSQRILRALPTPILKVANSSFMNATSSSLTTSLPKSPRKNKRKSIGKEVTIPVVTENSTGTATVSNRDGPHSKERGSLQNTHLPTLPDASADQDAAITEAAMAAQNRQRQTEYDTRLTYRIWELATTNANPAVDLLVCLERRQPIGFRYVDINREVVIHHGTRDTRVPVDNIRWLGQTMRRCEVRVLDGEGHGLMASAIVMSNVLTEIAKEWEDWTIVVQGKRGGRRATITHRPSRSGIMV
jgi:pimeloyl-ACP methyl ester carboxylesterase